MQTSFIYDCAPRFVHQCALTASRSTGKERDTESGLDYFGARYYASSMGRFMSPDWADKPEAVPYSSLDNPQSLNLYGYVLNNPLSKADADGHWPWDLVLVGGGTLAGAGEGLGIGAALSNPVGWVLAGGAAFTSVLLSNGGGVSGPVAGIPNSVNGQYAPATANNAMGSSPSGQTNSPTGPDQGGNLPKPPTGKDSVPPDQRDPKRVSTAAEKDKQLAKQDGKCANCGEPVKPGEGIGHHVERHADGGKTDSTNVPVVCKDCHKDLHSPN